MSGMAVRPVLPAVVLTGATSLLAIAAAAGVYLAVRPAGGQAEAASATTQSAGASLIEGQDYRVLVVVARIRPEAPGGGKWDAGGSAVAAPDPFYEIAWRGTMVYRSAAVENALVASWSNIALPELYKLITEKKLSLETIREGALVNARATDTIEVRIWDHDPLRNDPIEEFTLPIADLRVGDQVVQGRSGLESATLRVIPQDTGQLRDFLR